MSDASAIEWTDATWNPVTGCDRVSPGCAHCYALDLAARLKGMRQARYQRDGDPRTSGPGFGVTLHPDKLEEPLRWRKPRRVFVNSMSDLFHEEIPDDYIAEVYSTMYNAHWHTFQVLTKRPERMAALVSTEAFIELVQDASERRADDPEDIYVQREPWPPRNVWLGVSIENRRFVHRADLLRDTPAAVRFISAEPLLGPLVTDYHHEPGFEQWTWDDGYEGRGLSLHGIDWLIVGGESGPAHRRVDPQWVRDLRDWADLDGCAFFFKQWGGRTPKSGGRLLDGRTWDEMPTLAGAAA